MADHSDQLDLLLPVRLHFHQETAVMTMAPDWQDCKATTDRTYVIRHSEIYRAPREFAGWPANYGLWIWGDEAVTVFVQGLLGKEGKIHARDRNHPFRPRQARSLDGGRTWVVEPFNGPIPGGETLSADEHVIEALQVQSNIVPVRDLRTLDAPIDFLDRETIVMAARTGIQGNAISWFYVSRDRAHTWQGPYPINDMGMPGISARTDIVALAEADALFMLTSTKSNGEEGRVFCARTKDGGRSFAFQSFVMEETKGFAIMSSTVRMHDGRILTAVRRGFEDKGWIDMFVSDDLGMGWSKIGCPIETGFGGNPPALSILPDHTLVLVYGYRDKPYGIRCRLSHDGGMTWLPETIIQGDGGAPDLGYPRIVIGHDGSLLTVYYFNYGEDAERFIASSIFHASEDQPKAS